MLDISRYRSGQVVRARASLKVEKTAPPGRLTEGELVRIMEDVNRFVEVGQADRSAPQAQAAEDGKAGIGTARTRSEIIRKLFEYGFLERVEDRQRGVYLLRPTQKALDLHAKIKQHEATRVLISPEMTAQWEAKLAGIEAGEVLPEAFLSDIAKFVERMVLEIGA